jgi:putative colanic acid biosynthesis acetyltransferase WcaF
MYLDNYRTDDYHPGASNFKQILWFFIGDFLVQTPLIPLARFKVFILRLFGAQIGQGVNIKPQVKIKFPWRLIIKDYVWLGEKCWIDNLAPVIIESHVCISQGVYLCTGNHDWSDRNFKLITKEIYIEEGSWIGASAIIAPGVRVGKGAILTLGSVAINELAPMTIYVGNPAHPVKTRNVLP